MADLNTRAAYLEQIQEADAALADRVEEVRDNVRAELRRVAELKRPRRRLQRAPGRRPRQKSPPSGARPKRPPPTCTRWPPPARPRLASLKSKIEGWVGDIEAAEAASREAAEEEVGRWLGGPFTIPSYIVMCESGGDYGALNASSGAGGAYQILPSTWALYGGQGEPQSAPKEEQDRIAAEIWADSGGSAWVCAG